MTGINWYTEGPAALDNAYAQEPEPDDETPLAELLRRYPNGVAITIVPQRWALN